MDLGYASIYFIQAYRKDTPAEFQYRFGRRIDLPGMLPRLAYVAVRIPPMPMRLLKLAEKEW
jgi:hypothetical protein